MASHRPGMALGATPGSALRMTAGLALATETAIHIDLAPDHLHEVPYIGAGFVVASVVLAGVLIGLAWRPASSLVWLVGTGVCVGMAAMFVASRTVGLPGLHEEWTSDGGLGIYALFFEAIFVMCAARALPAARRAVSL